MGIGGSGFAQRPPNAAGDRSTNLLGLASNAAESKKTPERQQYEKSLVDHLLYRDRAFRTLKTALNKAVSQLKSGKTVAGLRLLQGLLDRDVDTQIWSDSDGRLTSIRREASQILRRQPGSTQF